VRDALKMITICQKCAAPAGGRKATFMPGEVLDDGTIDIACPAGHHTVVALHLPKFDILFEGAGVALLDEYYRESVMGVAAAIERFFEFYIRVVCRKLGLPEAQLKASWKLVSNSSERQLGTFVFVHALHTRKAPDLKAYEKWKEMRNKTAHNGYLPTKAEARGYAGWAFGFLCELMIALRASAPSDFDGEILDAVRQVSTTRKVIGASGYMTMLSTTAPLSWTRDRRTFESALEYLSRCRAAWPGLSGVNVEESTQIRRP
jgi:hypothetical protein